MGVPLGHARAALRRLQQHRGSQKSPVWTYLFDVIESFLLGLVLKHFGHFLLLTFEVTLFDESLGPLVFLFEFLEFHFLLLKFILNHELPLFLVESILFLPFFGR